MSAFKVWIVGTIYNVGNEVTHMGTLYRCLQSHRAYAAWAPNVAPQFWKPLLPAGSTSLMTAAPTTYGVALKR